MQWLLLEYFIQQVQNKFKQIAGGEFVGFSNAT